MCNHTHLEEPEFLHRITPLWFNFQHPTIWFSTTFFLMFIFTGFLYLSYVSVSFSNHVSKLS